MRRDLPSVVLLIDYDNLEIGASFDLPGRPLDLGSLVEVCQRYGSVIVARAYADWGDPNERLAVYESGIEPCFAPIFRAGPNEPGKSLADTVLVADGVDILWRTAPDVLVLVTSDKDILPLARLARLRGTRTVVVGSDRTALPLRRLADEYVTYRDIVRGTGVPVASNQRAGLVPLSRSSGTELRSPRLLAEARPAAEARKPAEPRPAEARERPSGAGRRVASPVAEPRPPVEVAPASEEALSTPGAAESASSNRRRRRRRGRGSGGGDAIVALDGVEATRATESEPGVDEGAETPTELLRDETASPAELADIVETSSALVLSDEDSASEGARSLIEADALEEQTELAPPSPPRPTFGSFAPLVPNETLTPEPPRALVPDRLDPTAVVEPEPSDATRPEPELAPVGASVADDVPSADAAEPATDEPATAPAPRRRRTRTPSRPRRASAAESEAGNGVTPDAEPS